MKSDKLPLLNGFTGILKRGEMIVISHAGNMGNTIKDDVKPNVDAMLGKGSFDKLQPLGTASGAPDYLYELKIPIDSFNKAFT